MIKAFLLDIEGTTTPIDFVHKVLFPYAARHIGEYVALHFDDLRPEIEQLSVESAADEGFTEPFDPTEPGSVSHYLEHLIACDRKSTPLKAIQGNIWCAGYESGELISPVFSDVPDAFAAFRNEKRSIAIYSSGSVLAQKLIFRWSESGDLTPFISFYFDTNVGHKRETQSYTIIAAKMGLDPQNILFASDIAEELDAAAAAGCRTALAVRPGNAKSENVGGHPRIESLTELIGI